ncbi:YfhO family protein [Subsaximicrobium wynnwilliamsii]|uniref:YfhO family protein n=1 Tax=Subsaximicrobium wynnwilliamsii TaxID=291179 RepID=A0A5C6ZJ24_9FLAO|nr:YfhO family protein [Subsaximicrobium wynnwilliamsii]TXD82937.1 YfhO family protein [Subsaximicrobium wynnwilliamsii]TXD88658.1 YfhO family protein [Subsaximicrobium wynnwilliamsii]TXE02751.1 YfhO family protein [Subsaximicrobium wynnwilliamsii]
MQFSFKKILPHLLVLIGFVVVSLIYFSPVLQGKQIEQSDIMHYIGMSKQQKEFKAETGEETYWTDSAFGGMPTYQLGAAYPHNYIKKLDTALRFLPRPADYLFIYFLGFYVLLLALKVDYRLSALGALAFGFSTYLIIILGVGHNSKAHAIAYMPLVLSGIILTFRKRYIFGFLLTTIALGLEIQANHFQMTYYLMLLVLVLGVAYLVDAYRKKMLPHFFKSVGIMSIGVILAVGLNATNIMATQEYVKESTRGKSDLTINADGSQKEITSGLSKDYITEYSYGLVETFNLFIPRFLGGGSGEDVGKDSASYEFYKTIGASPVQALEAVAETPTYWGDQTIVEAPAYIGAVVIFLFVFALFLVKGRLKWWLVGASILSLLLSYGKNFGFLTDFFIDYVPLYNKFRAVSSIQVIIELCLPVLAIFGLVKLFNDFDKDEDKLKALKYSTLIVGGLALVFLLFKSTFFDFVGARDGQFRQMYGEYGQAFVDALKEDRKSFFTQDTLRTLILVLLSAGSIFMFLKKKISENVVIGIFAILILFDLVGVNRRYVNNDNFVSALQVNKPYQANAADLEVLKDKTHFRVLDVSQASAMPARAAYFHNSLSGYHAAKLKRFDELYDFHIAKNNMEVLNMLNTKYIIVDDEANQIQATTTYTQPNGNAWFVSELEKLNSANAEIKALDSLNTKVKAVTTASDLSTQRFTVDSLASIKLSKYEPNLLEFETNNAHNGFAVFSEIYYGNGWQVTLDGKKVPHHRVNYVLRGMNVPAGTHKIVFKFEPEVIQTGSQIALGSSILLILLIFGGTYMAFRRTSETSKKLD